MGETKKKNERKHPQFDIIAKNASEKVEDVRNPGGQFAQHAASTVDQVKLQVVNRFTTKMKHHRIVRKWPPSSNTANDYFHLSHFLLLFFFFNFMELFENFGMSIGTYMFLDEHSSVFVVENK